MTWQTGETTGQEMASDFNNISEKVGGVSGSYLEKYITSSLVNIDASDVNVVNHAVATGTTDVSFVNLPDITSGKCYTGTLFIKDTVGSTYTWPEPVVWTNGEPAISQGDELIVILCYFSGLQSWVGSHTGASS